MQQNRMLPLFMLLAVVGLLATALSVPLRRPPATRPRPTTRPRLACA